MPHLIPQFTRHAIERMQERKITRYEVEYCLNHPEIIRPGGKGTRILIGYPDGRFVKIVVSLDNPRLIITAAD